ncbi:thioredoxin-like protein [Cristinia sonorae]|uniref:Thioredoxin-like protein n=1 Tax=Cristinia sonorae TaxID=1940300 RepID=A0A8K0XMA0_9AGAR|nr:thioredoxin-like protein [Cristinia sonorae]
MPETLTLYTAKICPYAHRVELALAEAKAEYKRFDVDLGNKPEWYAPKVNPASKVPAVAYGGPDVPPDQPSPNSTKIAESLVLLEFVADLYPSAKLLPEDPVLRAKVRFFIDAVSNKFNPAYFSYVITGKGNQEGLIQAFKDIQVLLPETGFAVGNEWSIADASITPFIARLFVALENDLGAYAVGEGPKTLELIKTSPELKRIQTYIQDVTTRPSFTSTFDPELIKTGLTKRFANITRASS